MDGNWRHRWRAKQHPDMCWILLPLWLLATLDLALAGNKARGIDPRGAFQASPCILAAVVGLDQSGPFGAIWRQCLLVRVTTRLLKLSSLRDCVGEQLGLLKSQVMLLLLRLIFDLLGMWNSVKSSDRSGLVNLMFDVIRRCCLFG